MVARDSSTPIGIYRYQWQEGNDGGGRHTGLRLVGNSQKPKGLLGKAQLFEQILGLACGDYEVGSTISQVGFVTSIEES